jgi:hypothetical protein
MSVALESSLAVSGARTTRLKSVEWCLRIGAAACFIGHGAFGVITKDAWVTYFGVVGIGQELAYTLMPIVGSIDIAAGVIVLFSPRPAVLLYMTVWALWTALLRPLAGETFLETLERAGNYGVPLALLWMYATPTALREVFAPVRARPVVDRLVIGRILLGTTAVLLFAHGALQAITRKPLFAAHYAAIDVPGSIAPLLGTIEMGVALLVLVAPVPALLVGIALWKVATESLFPIAGTPIWELIERGGCYAAPLALVLLLGTSPFTRINLSRSTR